LGSLFSIPPTNLPATANMIASVIKFPLVFISGIFISLDQLPAWGQGIAYISPLTYFTDIARHCIAGAGYIPVAIDLLALLAFIVLFLTLNIRLHSRTMPRRI
jgi:ABC-2 type transport system permease protein